MTPRIELVHGNSLNLLRDLDPESVDAVVTDPPYGLEFMGREWDRFRVDDPGTARHRGDRAGQHGGIREDNTTNPAAGRVEYGGGHRPTTHRCTGCGKRDQFRNAHPCDDRARWVKISLDPYAAPPSSLAFQEWARTWAVECLRVLRPGGHLLAFGGTRTWHRLACAVEEAGFDMRDSIAWLYGSGFPKSLDVSKAIDAAAGAQREVVATIPDRWAGKGDVLARAAQAPADTVDLTTPATDDAKQWQGWGTALKPAHEPIVVARKPLAGTVAATVLEHGTGALNIDATRIPHADAEDLRESTEKNQHARFGTAPGQNTVYGDYSTTEVRDYDGSRGRWPTNVVLDPSQAAVLDRQELGASRFMVRAGWTVDDLDLEARFRYAAKAPGTERVKLDETAHPTVKPLDLMRWLVRLVTPPGGTVLDPFAGSGTTAEACLLEGFGCMAIEREADFLPLIRQRLDRRRDPVAAVRATGADPGLFELLGGES